ncbi:MAG TPA: MinD/ParA family protein [Proteobacteria bacterium]|nr:flagellum site-determining protein YlxH [bacterium BMS3Abin14]HDL54073.1 MinD/ParA family protein [Pseudomonadota bacterium]
MFDTPPLDSHARGPCIWAIGGGKGGVGKSVITANMAIHLARIGKRCVAMDADLGGANLHTVIGMPTPKRTLTDFLCRKVPNLTDIMTPTPIPNLWLISGSRALMEMANPKHTQKEKILRHLHNLDVDYILLDLGSGTTFNILDFFLVAQEGILVVLPEPTSVENVYHFIKAAFYRKLKRATRKSGVAQAVDRAMEEKVARGIQSPRTLIKNVFEIDPEAGRALQREADNFRPNVIINQLRKLDERDLGRNISIACRDYFGIDIRPVGAIDEDECVRKAIRLKKPVIDAYAACPFSHAIHGIVRNLMLPPGDRP